jgi:hypothetical protein
VLNNVVYVYKTKDEWFILKDKTFSFKEVGEKGVTECNFGSIQVTTYVHDNKLQQLFIYIPTLQKTFFLSSIYPDLDQFLHMIQTLKTKNQIRYFGRTE